MGEFLGFGGVEEVEDVGDGLLGGVFFDVDADGGGGEGDVGVVAAVGEGEVEGVAGEVGRPWGCPQPGQFSRVSWMVWAGWSR
ncbi:hypothetical protein B1K54_01390 [Streptomyces sp. fd1-xmd]|nr:hypothetical protein B1K54_01390 [Streptomyces sp. fd1-xmd]